MVERRSEWLKSATSFARIDQGSSPICRLVCAVMIRRYMGDASIQLTDHTGGVDPGNSSIPNPASSLPDLYQQLWDLGFLCVCPASRPTEKYLKKMLKEKGPLILTHRLYGEGLPPDATHSVVLAGIDTVRDKKVVRARRGRHPPAKFRHKVYSANRDETRLPLSQFRDLGCGRVSCLIVETHNDLSTHRVDFTTRRHPQCQHFPVSDKHRVNLRRDGGTH
ncbi:MAG: hypothetical protein JNL98_13390 [Bryobacterales bacterium]|nr:hypothetical protein [Bryobacterales bacterium]